MIERRIINESAIDETCVFFPYRNDKNGNKLLSNADTQNEFCAVVPVEINLKKELPPIRKFDVPLNYMKKDYYFVEPPFMFKFYQKLCFSGFEKKYDELCRIYSNNPTVSIAPERLKTAGGGI